MFWCLHSTVIQLMYIDALHMLFPVSFCFSVWSVTGEWTQAGMCVYHLDASRCIEPHLYLASCALDSLDSELEQRMHCRGSSSVLLLRPHGPIIFMQVDWGGMRGIKWEKHFISLLLLCVAPIQPHIALNSFNNVWPCMLMSFLFCKNNVVTGNRGRDVCFAQFQ